MVKIALHSELPETPDLTGQIDNYTRLNGTQEVYNRESWWGNLLRSDGGGRGAVSPLEDEIKQEILYRMRFGLSNK